jgi:hypothetical protein
MRLRRGSTTADRAVGLIRGGAVGDSGPIGNGVSAF